MVTPNDIATKDFKKVMSGYSPEEVDTFLDEIYEDYEVLYRQAQQAQQERNRPQEVQEDSNRIRSLEKTLERTLTLAEAAAEETKDAARAEAAQIVERAKLEREEILSSSRAKIHELLDQIETLQNRYELMRTRVKLLLYAEIELLDKNEIFAEKAAEMAANMPDTQDMQEEQ